MKMEIARVTAMGCALALAAYGVWLAIDGGSSRVYPPAVGHIFGPLYALLGAGVYLALTDAPLMVKLRRWLLWNVHCHRGRRCANMVFTGPPEGVNMEIPPGSVAFMEYQCGGCGSVYKTSCIMNGDSYTQTDRVRIG